MRMVPLVGPRTHGVGRGTARRGGVMRVSQWTLRVALLGLIASGGPWSTGRASAGEVCAGTFPACDGACQPGERCRPGFPDTCECEPVACGADQDPTCNGSCPVGQRCEFSAGG